MKIEELLFGLAAFAAILFALHFFVSSQRKKKRFGQHEYDSISEAEDEQSFAPTGDPYADSWVRIAEKS